MAAGGVAVGLTALLAHASAFGPNVTQNSGRRVLRFTDAISVLRCVIEHAARRARFKD